VKKVEISFILDETGSMFPLKSDTVGGFNEFVRGQKGLSADVTFSLTMFSDTMGPEDKFRHRYTCVPITDVPEMRLEDYNPRGVTPLLDAVGGTIDALGARLASMPESERPDQVIVVILTDGLENASVEYSADQVREKVKHQREKYSWEFVFLGVGIDAFAEGEKYGMPQAYTSSQAHTAKGVRGVYASASCSISDLVDGGSSGGN
jgi:hypothetical protein